MSSQADAEISGFTCKIRSLGALAALGFGLASLGLSSAGCMESPALASTGNAAEERSIPVTLSPVRRAPVVRSVRAAGTLEARHELDLSFKIGGIVSRVTVDDGAHVRRGQVLAVIDPTEVRAGAAQADQAVTKAERDVQRLRELRAQQGAAQNMLDDAETQLAVARENAASAAFNLKHTELVAPDDGVIDRRMIEVGEIVAPGRPVFHLSGRTGGMVVRMNLSDRDTLTVSNGDLADVSLDARPDGLLRGHVSQIATSAQPGAGTFAVEVTLDAGDLRALPSGLTAKVQIDHLEPEHAHVPITALVDGEGERAAVFVPRGQTVKRVPVTLSLVQGEEAILASGLDAEAQVVSTGAAALSDGAHVRVVR